VESSPRNRWVGALLVLVSATGFSAKAIFAKLVYRHGLDPETLLALRMLFALPFFIAMAWWAGRRAPLAVSGRELAVVAGFGVIGYYGASYLDFLGLQYISAALERLTLFLNPTFVLLISALWLERPITRRDALAFAVSYAGIGLAFWHDLAMAGGPRVMLGMALVLGSAVAYAIYLVGSGELVRRLGSLRYTAYAMFGATAVTLAQFVATRPLAMLIQPAPVNALMLAMALFATVLPVWLMAEGVRRIGSASASMAGMAGPIITIFMGASFLGEPVGWAQLAGAGLVLAGVAIITFSRSAT